MFLLIWLRKIYKTLSADASPEAIAFGILFGFILGFIPLLSGLGLFLIASLLIVRVQVSSALIALAIGKVLAFPVSALYLPVGEMLLEPRWLHGFWTWFLNLPVVAWLDLDHHAIVGGAMLGLILGLVLFLPIRGLVIGYRRFLHERVSTNKFFRWFTSFWLIKGLRFVFIGAEVKL